MTQGRGTRLLQVKWPGRARGSVLATGSAAWPGPPPSQQVPGWLAPEMRPSRPFRRRELLPRPQPGINTAQTPKNSRLWARGALPRAKCGLQGWAGPVSDSRGP